MRRRGALSILLVSLALLAGCGSSQKHTMPSATAAPATGSPSTAAGTPGPVATTDGGGATTGTSGTTGGTGGTTAGGTVVYGWIIGTSGATSVRVDLANHLVNTATNKAATRYLQTHGGTQAAGEGPGNFVDVDLGTVKTYPIAATATVSTTAKGAIPQKLDVAGFIAWLRGNLAKPLAVSMRLKYQGAPHWNGPLWMMTVRNHSIVSIGQVIE